MGSKEDFQHLLSVQPFWAADKLHQDLLMNESTGAPLAVVYELQSDPGTEALQCVPGIGLIGILFSLSPEKPGAVCCGALNQSKAVPLYGMPHVLSCQFFPGEFTRIFGVPSSEMADAEIPLEDLLHAGSITEELAEAKTFEERLTLTRSFIRQWENRTRDREAGKVTQAMMKDVLQRRGNIRISELEDATGYSARYLQKIMLEHVGLAPKKALDNIRFQSALRMVMEQPGLPIAEVAQRCGYYDQSHFTKVFKEYTGSTPLIFQERFKQSFLAGKEPRK